MADPETISRDFVHLHVHTDYSMLDGCSRIDRLMDRACDMNMRAVAITDHGNLFGLFDFWNEAKQRSKGDVKLKPLLGCELYLVWDHALTDKPDRREHKYFHMGVLARNFKGYQNLTKLVSDAHVRGLHYKPRTDLEQLAKHADGLIGFSGCLQGVIPQALLRGDYEAARKACGKFVEIFGRENFVIELMDHGLEEQKRIIADLLKLAGEFQLRVVATNDVHYVDASDSVAHDAMLCIQTGARLADERRMRYSATEFYLKSEAEMLRVFGEVPESIKNTVAIAEMCDVKLPVGQNNYPVYIFSEGVKPKASDKIDAILDGYEQLKNGLLVSAGKPGDFVIEAEKRKAMRANGSYLLEQVKAGLKERYAVDYDDPKAWKDEKVPGIGKTSPAELCRRVDYEMGVIAGTGFVDYFLIVWDFIDWSRKHDIPVGPGRGSGAGSIVAYCLKITDIDPIRFGLLFERFLNPERVSAPDFDIDFCMRRRDEVVGYVRKKYGEDRVANIITFGTFGAKMVVRDLARIRDLPFIETNRLAKLVPDDINISLEDALKKSAELREEVAINPQAASIIETGRVIEGMVRNSGKHACGMIIADRPLTDIIPVTMQEGDLTTQYAKDPVEKLGLLKMDFLGLKTLTIIDDAQKLVRKHRGQADFDIEKLGFDDQATFALLNEAKTIGVFQLESGGMQSLCRKFRISAIDEIVALIALYRPGPMQFIGEYIKGKDDPSLVKYAHPLLEKVAKETYGILVYQEQVMEAARVIAGYTLGGADMLRRAMGKKIREEMEQQRSIFIEGAKSTNNIDQKKAEEIFATLEKFAEYGFNKSHSAAYAILSYRTAYLKANYPVEFMAAVLTSEQGNADKLAEFMAEVEALGMKALGPDVNQSDTDFTPVIKDNAIRFGLGAIKGVGEQAARNIVAEREKNGPYKDFGDFVGRLGEFDLNSRTLDCLVRAGAFDFTGEDRRHLVDSIESVRRHFAGERKERASGQGSLFDLLGAEDAGAARPTDLVLRKSEKMPKLEMLNSEKALLGFYLSGHPLAEYHGLDEAIATLIVTPDRIELDQKERHTVRICGIVGALEKKISKKDNRPWALFTVASRSVTIPVMMFSEAYDAAAQLKDGELPLLMDGSHVIVDARLNWRDERGEWSLSAHTITPLRRAPSLIKKILFALKPGPEAGDFLEKIVAHTRKVDGTTIVQVGFIQPDGRVLVAEAARGMTTRFDTESYGTFGRHPACAGVQIEPIAPTQAPQRKYGPSQLSLMRTLRIAFSDFIFSRNDRDRLASFDPQDNIFTRLLAQEYDVRVVPMAEAEVLVYSTFGEAHRAFRGRKVFYASENVLPDFDACDHAITFSHLPDDPRHFRLPQYVFYVDDARSLVKGPGFDAAAALRAKTKFCNFVVSNPRCPQRNRFFRMLNRRKRVDSGGRHFNNLGRPVADKLAFVRDYKFTLAFENSASDGYTTEKLVEPMLAGSLPIYWGNPQVALDFNPRSFIDVSTFPDFDAAIDHILKVDADDALYLSYLREPWFNGDTPPSWFDEGEHLAAWRRFLATPWVERPRVYRDRGLRDHALGTGLGRHLSSIGTKLDGLLWKAGWRF